MTDEEEWRLWLAWNDPGVRPDYHQQMQNRLRREWPVLASALDRMQRPTDTPTNGGTTNK